MSTDPSTQRRQDGEDRPEEREALLRAIIETSPDGLITIQEEGIIQSFNSAAERLFGYAAAEVVGRNVSCLMPSPYREQHDSYVQRYLRTGEKRIIGIGREVLGERKDGSVFPLELAVGEVCVDGRRWFAGFVRDVSARQTTEQRLHQLRSELVHVSRLSEMGEMASALAHELNQPLTAIINYLQACRRLLGGQGGERVGELMQKAADQATRAGEIIHHLRRFIARGETERTLEQVNPVIEEAARLALVGAGQKGIAIAFDLATTLPPVLINKVQIQQVIINLVRNGVDALADAERRQIMVRSAPSGPDAIEIDVVDTGPGLAAEVVGRLFQPFVTTKPGGIGIGLSICRTIAEAHDGKLWATANPGGGTVFHLRLPKAPVAEGRDDG